MTAEVTRRYGWNYCLLVARRVEINQSYYERDLTKKLKPVYYRPISHELNFDDDGVENSSTSPDGLKSLPWPLEMQHFDDLPR